MPEQEATQSVTFEPDGGAEVDLTDVAAAEAMQQPSEVFNYAAVLAKEATPQFPSYRDPSKKLTGPEVLAEIGNVVCEEYDADEASRAEWREALAKDLKLFASFMQKKTTPWEGASNVNVPMMCISTIQFHARAVPSLLPPKEIVRAYPTSVEDRPRAERVQQYMNYQLLYEMDEFEEGMDKTLIQLPIEGSVFRKTYYDPIKGRSTSQYVSAMDLVVDYSTRRLEEARRITHLLRMSRSDIMKRVLAGVYLDSAAELKAPSSRQEAPGEAEIRDAVDTITGRRRPTLSQSTTSERLVLEQHRGWDFTGDGVEHPYVITVDYETRKVLRITERVWPDPATGREAPVDYFTHYEFIPNPEGFYALGFGALLRGLNESANTIINEVIDAGALANLQGGFVSKRSTISKGALTFKMGEFVEFDGYVDDIRKAVYNFDFKGPNVTLFHVLGLIFEYSRQVSAVSETMTGQMPASDTPASTVLALIEEGRKVFSTIHKRLHRAFKKELRKLYRLNSIFLDEQRYFHVLGEDGMPDPERPEEIGKIDFADVRDVVPVSDPEIVSKAERVLKAQQIWEITLSSPVTAQNQAAVTAAQMRLYQALDVDRPQELLPPPPEPPDLPPEEENAGFFTEQPAKALPQQDHQHHLGVHTSFKESLFVDKLSPTGRRYLDQHIQEHLGLLYLAQAQAVQQLAAGGGGMQLA